MLFEKAHVDYQCVATIIICMVKLVLLLPILCQSVTASNDDQNGHDMYNSMFYWPFV